MVSSSSILLAAGNLQTLSTMACTNASLLMIFQSLPPYMRQLRAAVEETAFGPPIQSRIRNELFGSPFGRQQPRSLT
jgi:hypothetical protein